ncbi:unnamed protein product, partial [marine sediment metagenome]
GLLDKSMGMAEIPDEADDCPLVYVTGKQFGEIADLLGARLPTEIEWERAAVGAGNEPRTYSFGNEFNPNKAAFNCKGTRSVFAHRDYGTPEGILDLSGNVWEWTSTLYSEDWADPSNHRFGSMDNPVMLRGCSWAHNDPEVLEATYSISGPLLYKGDGFGARFAKD